jgi:hypothetical protein
MSLESTLSNSEQLLLESILRCLSITFSESNTFQLLSLLSCTSCFGEVSIVGYQPSTLGLVMVPKIRFHGAHDAT